MLNLLSLPRTSWKVRLVFAVLTAVVMGVAIQQWPHRHDDLAVTRWIAWFILVSCLFYLPRMLVVVVFGRLPEVYARMTGRWNKTLPQIHADIAREQQEQRDRSREL
jgi:L-cystine uptake protein TcyP (sodium:dicarboxylate symporter family)